MIQTFATLEQFYTEDPRRRLSSEYDFGVWWRDVVGGVWRVSWVADTGEVYALRLGPSKSETITIGGEAVVLVTAGSQMDGPLVLLGEVPASYGECTYEIYCHGDFFHSTNCPAGKGFLVEQVLDGWAERCGEPNSLDWVKERVS